MNLSTFIHWTLVDFEPTGKYGFAVRDDTHEAAYVPRNVVLRGGINEDRLGHGFKAPYHTAKDNGERGTKWVVAGPVLWDQDTAKPLEGGVREAVVAEIEAIDNCLGRIYELLGVEVAYDEAASS